MFAEKMGAVGGGAARRPTLPTAANRGAGGKKRPPSPLPPADTKTVKRVSILVKNTASKTASKTATKMMTSSLTGKSINKPKIGDNKAGKKLVKKPTKLPLDPNEPVPMHVAIAQIKESYPNRRQAKELVGWEGECLKFFKQLMKHPWVSAERPKYIFHVPVPILFPEIRVSYAEKIKNPMDLTTAESKLLQGVYENAEVFVRDIALVFANAIEFNKEGHDLGEGMSCAYYEASTHLLKYSRWISLEILQPYLSKSSSSVVVESGAAASWKLTERNRMFARKEMETIVFGELIDRTEPGDRYSWTETECERLMKSIRHMSDAKHMMYFVEMSSLPADYTAYISKPIAWGLCNDKLKERRYATIGEVVDDLRLIFANALKYNESARHVNAISQSAYDSAKYMSQKLEAAIDKMLLSVGDRIGRERVDMMTARRDMEAKQRERQEKMKKDWEKEHPGQLAPKQVKLRIFSRRGSMIQKKAHDFEFPFDDDDQMETHDDLRHIKKLYEKQRDARKKCEEISFAIGLGVFKRLSARAAAREWCYNEARKMHLEQMRLQKEKQLALESAAAEELSRPKGAKVSDRLHHEDRKHIKMIVVPVKKPRTNKAKRVASLISFD